MGYYARPLSQRTRLHANDCPPPLDDLIQTGILGLIDAVEKFDPSKEVKFKTYAEIRIKGTSDLYRCGSVRAENKVVLYGRNPADLRQVADVFLKMAHELERLGVGVPA